MSDANGATARLGSPAGRWIVWGMVLGSAVTFVYASVVNVAIPSIAEDLDAGTAGVQWIANTYLLPLAGLILVAGSAGDLVGHRRVFLGGAALLAVSSVVCAVAPSLEVLLAARLAQGVGAAAMTPASLAVIDTSFPREERSRAVAAWAGGSALATAAGPFLGGVLVDELSWRWVFIAPLPLLGVAVYAAARHVTDAPRTRRDADRLDVPGAVTSALAVSGVVVAFVQAPVDGWSSPLVLGALVVAAASAIAFVFVERRVARPLVPTDLFRSRQFTGANVMTVLAYFGLGGAFFFTAVAFQTMVGWSASAAGAALVPSSVVVILGSPVVGRWSTAAGPRWFAAGGAVVLGAGFAMLSAVDVGASYVSDVLPGALVAGAGLALMVPTLTAAVLASVHDEDVGIGSAVNNAAARASGLLAIATLPALVGEELDAAYTPALLVCAAACAAGGVVAAITFERGVALHTTQVPALQAGCSQRSLPAEPAPPAAHAATVRE
jgi:EmrB/QacA subfamily drug resistance transporter